MKVKLTIDEAVDEMTAGLDRKSAAVKKAKARATRKLFTWLKRQVLQTASRASGVSQKVFKDTRRVLMRYDAKKQYAFVWLGTNPIAAHKVGKVRQLRAGIRAGKFPLVAGAFKAKGRAFKRRGESSYPVDTVIFEIDKAIRAALTQLQPRTMERFKTLLEQELNYAINHEKP